MLRTTRNFDPVVPTPGTESPNIVAPRGEDKSTGSTTTSSIFGGLSDSDRWGLFTSGVSALLSAGSIYTKGKYEAAMLRANARALEINIRALKRDIKDIAYVTGIQASNTLKQAAEMKGKQYAAQAESGFSVSETESFVAQRDYTDILAQDQINQYAYEAALETENKRNEMAKVRTEQELKRIESKYVKKTSAIAAGLQLINGAARMAGAYYL